jgi:hypothetical protein
MRSANLTINPRRVMVNGSGATIKPPPGWRASAVMATSISASSSTGVAESSAASDAAPASNSREPGKPWQNGVAESFNGKFRDECLSLEWFRSRAEAKVLIEEWRHHYNHASQHPSVDVIEEKRLC